MTKEEIKKFVSDLRRENPELARDIIDSVEETVELKKKELEAMRVIDIILQAGQSLSKKYDIIYEARFKALLKKLDNAQLLKQPEIEEIEKEIAESNKFIINRELELRYNICQETVKEFNDNLEIYLDVLGVSPEGKKLNPIQPYQLQLTSTEKKQLDMTIERLENLIERGKQLSHKFKNFIENNAEELIHYHFALLYFEALVDCKKQLSEKVKDDLDALNEGKKAKPEFVNEISSLSQAQWVLIYYYFFKQNGLEPRVTMDISPLARFIHLATGIKYSTVQNSDIYTKLSKVPNFKADKELLQDLEKIRPIFESHGFNDILQVIDKEIDVCKKRR